MDDHNSNNKKEFFINYYTNKRNEEYLNISKSTKANDKVHLENNDDLKKSINGEYENFNENHEVFRENNIEYQNENNKKNKEEKFVKLKDLYSNKISTSKYTWLNCIPKIFFEQFRKLANFYFLIIAMLQSISEISISDGKPVILLPLIFVVLVNGIKDYLEDFKRKKSDDEENNKIGLVYNPQKQKFFQKKWCEIKLGEIVKVRKDEFFPADLVLINSSVKEGECYIETKNLDGETNLKFKQSHCIIKNMFPNEESLKDFSGILKTKKPNHHIYEFDAIVKFNKVNKENLLLLRDSMENKFNKNKNRNDKYNNRYINIDDLNLNKNEDLIKIDNEIDEKSNNCILGKSKSNDIKYDYPKFNNNEIDEMGLVRSKSNNSENNFECFKKMPSTKIDEDKIIIEKSSFLLRGCILKNADFVIGLCVYVGHHTKIMKNSLNARYKISKLESMMSRQILIILIFQIILSISSSFFYYLWVQATTDSSIYLFPRKINYNSKVFIYRTGTWILIFTNLVPISLLVSLEMIKFVQGIYISWDWEIYDEYKDIPAKVQTSTLNEELGQVKYIFSDKTGTLTKNYMEFQEMSIGNKKYGQPDPGKTFEDKYGKLTNFNLVDENLNLALKNTNSHEYDLIYNFFICISACHSIIVERDLDKNNISYHSSSPDETALINCARHFGFIYLEKDCENYIYMEINGEIQKIKLLNILEYSSERKMMSVIVKFSDGRIRLYSKGADSMISSKLSYESKYIEKTENFLIDFARKGLRTLMVAYKDLDKEEYKNWNEKYKKNFMEDSENKNEKINLLEQEIESNLNLLGSTAINDELQDQLQETLDFFIKTGIKFWVLTGDKFDTAKSIAFSSKLITHFFKIYEFQNILTKEKIFKKLNECILDYHEYQKMLKLVYQKKNKTDKTLIEPDDRDSILINADEIKLANSYKFDKSALSSCQFYERLECPHEIEKIEKKKFSIIITSQELSLIIGDKELEEKFYILSTICSSVICCRISPKQKAEMVNLIKSRKPMDTTLAIGDGANDVNMICTAHIGVGIYGVEGRQASRASDYSIAKFSFLKKLLFVHGRESYRKNSFVVCYNFYKNVLFVIPQFWFGFSSGFSGQPLYDPWIYQLYNIIFSCLPIIWFGIYDKEEKHKILMKEYKLYYPGMVGKLFHSTRFWKWILYGTLQGYIIYIFCYHGNDVIIDQNGYLPDLYSQGGLSYLTVVSIVNFKILYATSSHTIYSIALVLLSLLSYIVCYFYMTKQYWSPIFNTFAINMSNMNSYLITMILMVICLVLDYGINKNLEMCGYLINSRDVNIENYEKKEKEIVSEEIEKTISKKNIINSEFEKMIYSVVDYKIEAFSKNDFQ